MTRNLALSKRRSAVTFVYFSLQCKLELEDWYRANSKLNWNRPKSCSASESFVSSRLGHRARNSDSTSIHYCEIWKLKKTFMLNLTISQNWWLASFKWKRKWPRLVNFTPDNSSQIDKRIVWDKFSTWSRLQRFTHKKVEKTVYKIFYGYK